jgi:murein DD-endopeptidase MepM/ murein hydrolase activator NlpD
LLVSLGLAAVLIRAAGDSGGGNETDDSAVVVATVTPSAVGETATPQSAAGNGAETPVANGELRGFVFPIVGACLPQGQQLMPNAPRPYRQGVHEGVDFYDSDNCVSITRGTPVVAAKAGVVIRSDLNYVDMTPAELDAHLANPTTDEALDAFRGRQVWIDHGGGVVTRYVHLLSIAPGITQGTRVSAGQIVAFVGESGTPESITNPGTEYHLHFEVWVGGSFLGKGLPPAEVRRLYTLFFSP